MYISIMSSSLRSDSVSPLVLQSSLVEDVDVLGNLKHSSHVLFDDEHVSPAILQDLHLLEDIVDEVRCKPPRSARLTTEYQGQASTPVRTRPSSVDHH